MKNAPKPPDRPPDVSACDEVLLVDLLHRPLVALLLLLLSDSFAGHGYLGSIN